MDIFDTDRDIKQDPVLASLNSDAQTIDVLLEQGEPGFDDYNHKEEDEEFTAVSKGLTVVFKVKCWLFSDLTNLGCDEQQTKFCHEHYLEYLQDLEYIVRNYADKGSKISLLKKVTGLLRSGLMSALVRPLRQNPENRCIGPDQ